MKNTLRDKEVTEFEGVPVSMYWGLDVKEALEEFKSKLDNKKLCCVYIDGDDPEPCGHGKEQVIKVLDEVFGEKFK